MPGMPHIANKGKDFEFWEEFLSDPDPNPPSTVWTRVRRKLFALGQLHVSTDLLKVYSPSGGGEGSQAGPQHHTRSSQSGHIKSDWLNGGYWPLWKGDTEDVLSDSFVRAIEVSLGLPHRKRRAGATVTYPTGEKTDYSKMEWYEAIEDLYPLKFPAGDTDPKPARDWPIDVTWVCPLPRLECEVSWKKIENSHLGRVRLEIHTPGNLAGLHSLAPYAFTGPTGKGQYPSTTSSSGSLLVGHAESVLVAVKSWMKQKPGGPPSWVVQPLTVTGENVIGVSPLVSEGGASRTRQW